EQEPRDGAGKGQHYQRPVNAEEVAPTLEGVDEPVPDADSSRPPVGANGPQVLRLLAWGADIEAQRLPTASIRAGSRIAGDVAPDEIGERQRLVDNRRAGEPPDVVAMGGREAELPPGRRARIPYV